MFPTLKELENNSNQTNILKLKPGEEIKGLFRGNSFKFFQHWIPGQKQPILCGKTNGDHCFQCEQGAKVTPRFKVNFLLNENGKIKPMIFEQGMGTLRDLAALNEMTPLDKSYVKIRRTGSGKDTRYPIIILQQVAPDVLKKIESIKLFDLKPKDTTQSSSKPNGVNSAPKQSTAEAAISALPDEPPVWTEDDFAEEAQGAYSSQGDEFTI